MYIHVVQAVHAVRTTCAVAFGLASFAGLDTSSKVKPHCSHGIRIMVHSYVLFRNCSHLAHFTRFLMIPVDSNYACFIASP